MCQSTPAWSSCCTPTWPAGTEKPPLWPGKANAPFESWYKHATGLVKRDLEAAGLDYIDDDGRVFDFHRLRGQFITAFAKAGVQLQVAQKLARHSTPVLTANIYTKLQIHDQAEAIAKLPGLVPDNAPIRGGLNGFPANPVRRTVACVLPTAEALWDTSRNRGNRRKEKGESTWTQLIAMIPVETSRFFKALWGRVVERYTQGT